jgi:hypothetical protein
VRRLYIYIGAVVDFEKVEIFREYSAGRDSGGKKIKKGKKKAWVGGWVGGVRCAGYI